MRSGSSSLTRYRHILFLLAPIFFLGAHAKSVGACQCHPVTCTPSTGDMAGRQVNYKGDCSVSYDGHPWCWVPEGPCGTAPLVGTTQTCENMALAFCDGWVPAEHSNHEPGIAIPYVDAVKVVTEVPETFVAGVESDIVIRITDADGETLSTDVNFQLTISAKGSETGSGLTRYRVGGDDSTFKWYGSMIVNVTESTAVLLNKHQLIDHHFR